MVPRAWEVFAENKLALVGLVFIVFILLFCFVGPHIYVTNQVNTDLINYLCTPSGAHLLGCDDLGYDELGRLMVGGQTSLEVGPRRGGRLGPRRHPLRRDLRLRRRLHRLDHDAHRGRRPVPAVA